jgi:hypothetical protein
LLVQGDRTGGTMLAVGGGGLRVSDAAQDTLMQNWPKYAAGDKRASGILRDARNIRNADMLEGDDNAISSRRRRRK